MRVKCFGVILLALVVLGAGCRKKADSRSAEPSKQGAKQQQTVSDKGTKGDSEAEPGASEPASVMPARSQAAPARQTEDEGAEYLAVFMDGNKVGHGVQTRTVTGAEVTTSEKVSMTISRANIPVTVNMTETSVESVDGKPLAFEVVQELAAMIMKVSGRVDPKGTVAVVSSSMGSEQKTTFAWPEGAVMAEGLRLLTLDKGLKEGLEYTVKVFSPGFMQSVDARVRIGPKRNVDLMGRVVALTEVTTAMSIPGAGPIVSTDYLDDELRTLKSIVPIAGIKVEMVACTKEFALGENDVFEVIDKMFLASPEPLEDVGGASSITYYLSPKKDAKLTIPSNDNQQVERLDDGKVALTVRPVAAAPGARFPYEGQDKVALEALKPARFVQSDRKEIIALARRAVGNTKDAAAAVRKIEAFVGEYVENKSLSVGYASAAEVAASKQGDCSEFAVLTVALCRAVGIPAQVVTGVAYVDDFRGFQGFGGHAWTQAYVGGKWVGLDAAFKGTGRGGYDAGHIALAAGNGDPEGFFDLVTTLGQFKIDKLVVENGR